MRSVARALPCAVDPSAIDKVNCATVRLVAISIAGSFKYTLVEYVGGSSNTTGVHLYSIFSSILRVASYLNIVALRSNNAESHNKKRVNYSVFLIHCLF